MAKAEIRNPAFGVCPSHSGVAAEIKSIRQQQETDREELWAAIDRLRNRLPVWATAVISVLTFLVGFMARANLLGK